MIVTEQPGSGSSVQAALDQRPIGALQVMVVLITMVVMLVEGADLAVLGLVAPKIASEWGLATGAFGPVFSSGSAGLLVGGVLFGFLADRFGRKRALLWATFIMSLGTLGTSFASSLDQLLIGRLITGVGFGGVIPASSALVAEFMPARRRAAAICLVILCGSVGVLVCSIVVRAMPGSDWRVMLWIVAASCFAVTFLTMMFLPESPSYLLLRGQDGKAAKILRRVGIDPATID